MRWVARLAMATLMVVSTAGCGSQGEAFAAIKRHYLLFMRLAGSMLIFLGIFQVTGVWTVWMNELQTRFGGASLPI